MAPRLTQEMSDFAVDGNYSCQEVLESVSPVVFEL